MLIAQITDTHIVPEGRLACTGLNEQGISIVIHQHWVSKVDTKGIVVGVAGEMALRFAKNIVNLARSHEPNGTRWS